MTTSRDSSPTEKKPESVSLLRHTYISAVATILSHPFRIALNRASLHQSPIATIKDTVPRIVRGVSTNLIRGTMAASTQSYTKMLAQEKAGFAAGIAASALAGTMIATLVETRLIRKVNMPDNLTIKPSLSRFKLPLTSLYGMREIGFTLAVLTTDDFTPLSQAKTLIAASAGTAMMHKFAVIEATRDLLPKTLTVPDFRQGLYYTIRSMANGNVYTHEAFKVPYQNPQNIFAKTGNLLHVSCGANMFLFRLIYLSLFTAAYGLAKSTPTTTDGWIGLFNKKPKNVAPVPDAYRHKI